MKNKKYIYLLFFVFLNILFTGCYRQKTRSLVQLPDSIQDAQIFHRLSNKYDSIIKQQGTDTSTYWGGKNAQIDSLNFRIKHHYSTGFNFVVKSDSLSIIRQQPEETINNLSTDSFSVNKGNVIVVADIRILPVDSIDSVWVHIATENAQFGWIHESKLLKNVVPADPISQFISIFSNIHLLIFLIVISIIAVGYMLRKIRRHNAKIVHFNDINSIYPTLLTTVVASAATFYASIQLFAPETWREFYFHPSLNPFSQPLLLNIFLLLVWLMLIVAIATIDDVKQLLKSTDIVLYLSGTAGICAVNYIVFSITTLYYIGYLLLILYIYFAFRQYWLHHSENYYCGNCGMHLHRKGRCPRCGIMNE